MKKATIYGEWSTIQIKHADDREVCKTTYLIDGENLSISDGYHTMDELYNHRHLLYIALCKTMTTHDELCAIPVWRSKSHSDGSMFDGMFILGIGDEPGKQITYHLPLSLWDQTSFAKNYETAPEWDGHTPEDVLNRLIIL